MAPTHTYILQTLPPSMRYLLLFGFVLVLASFASAQAIDWEGLDCQKQTYNGISFANTSIALPPDMANFLDGEVINLRAYGVARNVSGKVSGGRLHSIQCEKNPTASFDVSTSPDAIQKIVDSSNPMKTFKELLETNEILIIPYSGMAYIKMFFLNIALVFV